MVEPSILNLINRQEIGYALAMLATNQILCTRSHLQIIAKSGASIHAKTFQKNCIMHVKGMADTTT